MNRLTERWMAPEQVAQLELFPRDRKEVLAIMRVGEADLARWHAAGWLSDECLQDDEEISEPCVTEICFIADIARSGLFVDDIDRLLMQLQKPYSYYPTRIAYSFRFGWVVPVPPPDPLDLDEFMREHVHEWLMGKVFDEDADETFWEVALALADARGRLSEYRKGRPADDEE